MRQALAGFVAVFIVVAAVVVRGLIDDDDDEAVGAGAGDGPLSGLVVACIPELEEACRALEGTVGEVRIEPPAATIAALGDDDGADTWITLDPWPAIARFHRDDLTGLAGTAVGIATTPAQLWVRTATVPEACAGDRTWTCLAANTDRRAAVPDPGGELGATGTLILGYLAYCSGRTALHRRSCRLQASIKLLPHASHGPLFRPRGRHDLCGLRCRY